MRRHSYCWRRKKNQLQVGTKSRRETLAKAGIQKNGWKRRETDRENIKHIYAAHKRLRSTRRMKSDIYFIRVMYALQSIKIIMGLDRSLSLFFSLACSLFLSTVSWAQAKKCMRYIRAYGNTLFLSHTHSGCLS